MRRTKREGTGPDAHIYDICDLPFADADGSPLMLSVGGRERTEAEYHLLFGAAGLELNRVLPTTAEVNILETVRGPVLL
ncbi:MAG TPA: hypothetical protein PKM43_03900 [Verrucomicrobiota bacterium]|nr:hypothetical protein [Verrucomicrobiota bacterium]HRZ35169.1 hypothetical protein [Candidatus Paceibacterota bacterium]HRZ54089.1 hypothetical protein [Candidatus Paceibacterota bacterium]